MRTAPTVTLRVPPPPSATGEDLGVLGLGMTESGPRFGDREGAGEAARVVASAPMYEMSVAAVRALDRRAIDDFGIPGIVLMENAARAVAARAEGMLGEDRRGVVIVCGSGNNGGDGLAAGRHLANRGIGVSFVMLDGSAEMGGDAGVNLGICRRMGMRFVGTEDEAANGAGLVIDALFGPGRARARGGRAGGWGGGVADRRRAGARVLAVDVPSGLDADSGEPVGGVCVEADATVTLAAVKPGLTRLGAQRFVGELSIGDIGVPAGLLAELGRAWAPRTRGEEGDLGWSEGDLAGD